ncbi:Catechol O-methyltransferase (Partial), partial [Seminavis robusta]|eukprot:Sro1443_g273210.1 Catechol O-methyltransferase (160) ;mRNA; f:28750-29229
MAAEDDPFGAFGEDDDDDDEKDGDDCNVVSSTASVPESGQQQARRDPSCGVLVFHNGTEQALLHHVEREMELLAASDQLETAEQVMKLVDQYCFSRHWMMHIGDQKGIILKDFIREFCQEHQNRLIRQTKPEQTVIMVELGTYCGYSAILMAYTILEFTR